MKRLILRGLAYVVVIAGAVLAVYLATRSERVPRALAAGHGGVATSDSARPVMLTADQSRRIGVTYAVAALGTLEQEVRTVGQITYDETRIQAIAPKIDGWVERLLVNATGQPVSAGQPLFTIYSPMLVTAQEELLLARRLQLDISAGSADAQQNAADLVASARRRLANWDISESEIAGVERTGEVRRTLTLRFFGDQSVYDPREGGAGPRVSNFHDRMKAGDPFRHESFLQVRA